MTNYNAALQLNAAGQQYEKELQMQQPIKDANSNDSGVQLQVRLEKPLPNTDIQLVVRFYEVSEKWITQMYLPYNNMLWLKVNNEKANKKLKYNYKCLVCQRVLCTWLSIKYHLNKHLKIYPHKCNLCGKNYCSRSAVYSHTKRKHKTTQ